MWRRAASTDHSGSRRRATRCNATNKKPRVRGAFRPYRQRLLALTILLTGLATLAALPALLTTLAGLLLLLTRLRIATLLLTRLRIVLLLLRFLILILIGHVHSNGDPPVKQRADHGNVPANKRQMSGR
jgi:hypothetical protein